MNKEVKKKVTVYLPTETIKALKHYMADHDLNLSSAILAAINALLSK